MAADLPDPFDLLGREVEPRIRSAALRAWLGEHWWYPDRRRGGADTPGIVVREAATVQPPPGVHAAGTATLHGLSLDVGRASTREGPKWWIGHPSRAVSLLLAPEGPDRIEVPRQAAGNPVDPVDPVDMGALRVALGESLRARGLVPLHASAAAPPGGGVHLFLGRRGSGKTTTLWNALRSGWRPVAEDLVWLDPATGTVFGWDRGLRIRPRTEGHLLRGLPPGGSPTPDGRRFLPWAALPAAHLPSGPLEELVILERSPDGSRGWSDAPARGVVKACWEAAGVPLTPAGREVTGRAVQEVLLKVPARRLVLGGEAPEI